MMLDFCYSVKYGWARSPYIAQCIFLFACIVYEGYLDLKTSYYTVGGKETNTCDILSLTWNRRGGGIFIFQKVIILPFVLQFFVFGLVNFRRQPPLKMCPVSLKHPV